MANLIGNATGLDGTAGWFSTGGAVSVDESIEGARGRIVIKGTGPTMRSDRYAVAAGETLYASTHHAQGSQIFILFYTAAQGFISSAPLSVIRRGVGVQRRGLLSSFDYSKGAAVAPPTAALFNLHTETAGGAHRFLQPYASTVGHAGLWQPGPHANPDLDYPAWPTDLPQIMDEGLQLDPIPTRKGFSGDTGWEATRRTTRSRRYRMSGQLALTAEERDRLMQFFDEIDGPFWFTRPDTREVCLAQFLAEGEPVEGGQLPGRRRTQIKLQLRVV